MTMKASNINHKLTLFEITLAAFYPLCEFILKRKKYAKAKTWDADSAIPTISGYDLYCLMLQTFASIVLKLNPTLYKRFRL